VTGQTVLRTPSPPLSSPRAARRGAARGDGAWPWVFVLPLLTGIGVFFIWPMIQTAYYSFTEWGVFGGTTFTGVENYVRLFADPRLYASLGNTLIYTAVVLLGIPIAVYLASLLNLPGLRFASFYRVLFFLPYVAMPTAVAIVWRIIFNGDFGILNYTLSLVGIDGPYWISTPGTAMFAVAIVGLWSSLGFSMIILASGLKNIAPELYEAAELDGAGQFRIIRSIKLPALRGAIVIATIFSIIGSFQLFNEPNLLKVLAPNAISSFFTPNLYAYTLSFAGQQYNYSATIAIVMGLLTGVIAYIVQLRGTRSEQR
jgi:multiple sugar transport system permease protein